MHPSGDGDANGSWTRMTTPVELRARLVAAREMMEASNRRYDCVRGEEAKWN